MKNQNQNPSQKPQEQNAGKPVESVKKPLYNSEKNTGNSAGKPLNNPIKK